MSLTAMPMAKGKLLVAYVLCQEAWNKALESVAANLHAAHSEETSY